MRIFIPIELVLISLNSISIGLEIFSRSSERQNKRKAFYTYLSTENHSIKLFPHNIPHQAHWFFSQAYEIFL
jgi:hypothetical protein